jgi:hypothetical protein
MILYNLNPPYKCRGISIIRFTAEKVYSPSQNRQLLLGTLEPEVIAHHCRDVNLESVDVS